MTYVGLAVLVTSGWYGAQLVYVGGVGVKAGDEATVEERITEPMRTPAAHV